MVFDWKENKNEALRNGICEEQIFSKTNIVMKAENGRVENHTFRNFPKLEFKPDTLVENCVFEDCGDVTFDRCKVNGCVFQRFETVFGDNSTLTDSKFQEILCDNDLIISLEDGEISHCVFEDIELRNDAYLCVGYGNPWVEYCVFNRISTTRADRELFHCEDTVGKFFKMKKEYCIVDEETCEGLPTISG